MISSTNILIYFAIILVIAIFLMLTITNSTGFASDGAKAATIFIVAATIFNYWGVYNPDSKAHTLFAEKIETTNTSTYSVTIKDMDAISEDMLMISVTGEYIYSFTTDEISYKAIFSEGESATLTVNETIYKSGKSTTEYILEKPQPETLVCSNCGYTPKENNPNFCPDCGNKFSETT